jgi:hypothetical protein
MAIYVDDLAHWGWVLRGHKVANCHMFTDARDLEELHQFAERIGMKRTWFQPHRIAPHYDLTPRRRALALALGAISVNRREARRIWRTRQELVNTLAMPTEAA